MVMKLSVVFILSLIVTYSIAEVGPGIRFIENKNQWPSQFLFGADLAQAKVFLKKSGIYFVQYEEEPIGDKADPKLRLGFQEDVHSHSSGLAFSTFEVQFLNSRRSTLTRVSELKTIYNYYLGNDKASWGSGAKSYGQISYHGIYEGIDLNLYSSATRLKYDWVIAPCSDPGQIALRYDGVEDLEILAGELIIKTKVGKILETKPYAYQLINGMKRSVQCEYYLQGRTVGFVFPEGYDTNYELVIDPVLIFSSYSGSALDNWGNTATPDSNGNLYSGGMVSGFIGALGFPVTPGAYQTSHRGGTWDVGILKYDSIGANLLYVTYLGGSGAETPQSLVVNEDDELLILGATGSSNFPVTTSVGFEGGPDIEPLNGIHYEFGTDLFIAKLSSDGSSLLAATYLGGGSNDGINFIAGDISTNNKLESPLARNYGDQLRGDILADMDGNVFIASSTASSDFPVVNSDVNASFHGGSHDAVIAKLSSDLSTIIWSRLIGGMGTDVAYSVKLSSTGKIFAAGGTTSIDIQGMNGLMTTAGGNTDGWILEISHGGDQIVHGTYLGTSSYDQAYFIDLGTNGDVYAYGQTQGNKPIYPSQGVYGNSHSGQFLHCLTPDLLTTVFYTTIGNGNGTPDISPTAFLVNECNNIYMAGWGGEINGPNYFGVTTNYIGGSTVGLQVTPDAYQKKTVLGNDFYLIVLTEKARDLVYATYLGGTTSLTHVDGGTSRFDKRGVVYHAVCASCGYEADFPAVNVPAERSKNGSGRCNNAAFKFDLSALRARIQTNNAQLKSPGYTQVCLPDSIAFQNLSINGQYFDWDFGDGTEGLTTIDTAFITHNYKNPGTYTVKLKVTDLSTCVEVDSTFVMIDVFQPAMFVEDDRQICFGSSTRLVAGGGAFYAWKSADNTYTSTLASPLVTPEDTTIYYLTVTDVNGCVKKDTVKVDVVPGMDLQFEFERIYDCYLRPEVRVRSLTELKEGEEVQFSFGDGTTMEEDDGVHTYQKDDIYTVSLRGLKESCVYEEKKEVPVITIRVPNVITPLVADGLNDTFAPLYGIPPRNKENLSISLTVVNRWGREVYKNKYYKGDWRGEGAENGVYYYEMEIDNEVTCKGWIEIIK